jgi:hypothetical protein
MHMLLTAKPGTRERLAQLADRWTDPNSWQLASELAHEIARLEELEQEDRDKLRRAESRFPGEVPRIEERIRGRFERKADVTQWLELMGQEWAEINALARVHCPAARAELPTVTAWSASPAEIIERCERMKRALKLILASPPESTVRPDAANPAPVVAGSSGRTADLNLMPLAPLPDWATARKLSEIIGRPGEAKRVDQFLRWFKKKNPACCRDNRKKDTDSEVIHDPRVEYRVGDVLKPLQERAERWRSIANE